MQTTILKVKVEYENRRISKIAVLVDASKKSEEKHTDLRVFTAKYENPNRCCMALAPDAELSDQLINDVVLFGLKSEDISVEFPEFVK